MSHAPSKGMQVQQIDAMLPMHKGGAVVVGGEGKGRGCKGSVFGWVQSMLWETGAGI